ncbi:MAG TPA: hypothetical protein VG722_11080, partial [Tepidisphaeraceae bacterium]|nr:hypothetical protein [Tepidisphaeraceae bacterium]
MFSGRRRCTHRRCRRVTGVCLAALGILSLPASIALASSATWDGNSAIGTPGDGVNWNDANNWTTDGVTDTAPSSSADLTFGGGTVGQINLNGNQSVSSLHFTAGFALDALGTADTLNLNSGNITIDPSVIATINAELAENALTITGGGTLIASQINSSEPITVDGSTLIIDATSSRDFSGFDTDSTGAVLINESNTIYGNVDNNGTLTIAAGKSLSSRSG